MTYPRAVALLHELAANGDADELTDANPAHLFTNGGCALYAAAIINHHPDWQVIAYGYSECTEDRHGDLTPCGDYGHNVCGCKVHHFYAVSPDGALHDIEGAHDIATVSDRAYDANCALWAIDDTVLSNVMESWYQDGLDEHVAALALAVA